MAGRSNASDATHPPALTWLRFSLSVGWRRRPAAKPSNRGNNTRNDGRDVRFASIQALGFEIIVFAPRKKCACTCMKRGNTWCVYSERGSHIISWRDPAWATPRNAFRCQLDVGLYSRWMLLRSYNSGAAFRFLISYHTIFRVVEKLLRTISKLNLLIHAYLG